MPSWQAYSNIPSPRFIGSAAVNGRVKVVGSSTVNSYSSVSSATRRKRSVRCSVEPAPMAVATEGLKAATLSLKFVDSTTRVSPSQ